MNVFFRTLFFLLFSSVLVKVFAEPVIRTALFPHSPLIFENEARQPAGVIVDILDEIAKLENWTVEYVPGSWQDGLNRLQEEEVEIVTSVMYSEERSRSMDYSKVSVFTVWGVLFVQKDIHIENILEVAGKKIAVMSKDLNGSNFRNLCRDFGIEAVFEEYASFEDVLAAVDRGEVDAGVTNNTFGDFNQSRFEAKRTNIVFNPFDLYFCVKKGKNNQYLTIIDGYLENWKQNKKSIYHRSMDYWFSKNAVFRLPPWMLSAFFVVGFVLVALLASTIYSRWMVARSGRNLMDLNQKLNTINHELYNKNKEMESLLYITSHDLRSPLVNIQGFSHLVSIKLKQMAASGSPFVEDQDIQKDLIEPLDYIQQSVKRISTMLDGLLVLSRSSRKAMAFEKQDVGSILHETMTYFEYRISENKASVSLGDLPDCLGDKEALLQVFTNLFDNAFKYRKPDIPLELSVIGEIIGLKSVYRFSDNGIGIPASVRPKIFNVFFRVTTKGIPGEGLGLSVSKMLIDRMGGSIEVESEEGVGTTFVITLEAVNKKTGNNA